MNPVSQEILNAVDKFVPFVGRSSGGGTGSSTVVVELGQEMLRVYWSWPQPFPTNGKAGNGHGWGRRVLSGCRSPVHVSSGLG
jgi:hypothetical protein